MNSFEKVKHYLLELNYEIIKENEETGVFIINAEDKGVANMILDCEGDILILTQHIVNLPAGDGDIYKELLQLNTTLVHGAYALADAAGKTIIFRDTLQLANLDLNELEASINALTLSLAENINRFLAYAKGSVHA